MSGLRSPREHARPRRRDLVSSGRRRNWNRIHPKLERDLATPVDCHGANGGAGDGVGARRRAVEHEAAGDERHPGGERHVGADDVVGTREAGPVVQVDRVGDNVADLRRRAIDPRRVAGVPETRCGDINLYRQRVDEEVVSVRRPLREGRGLLCGQFRRGIDVGDVPALAATVESALEVVVAIAERPPRVQLAVVAVNLRWEEVLRRVVGS